MRGIFNILWFAFVLLLFVASKVGIPIAVIYCLLVFVGDEHRRNKALEKLQQTLMKDEKILFWVSQRRPFAFWSRRRQLAITPSRVIAIRRGIFGGFEMLDQQWKDVHDAQLSVNVLSGLCGANLSFVFVNKRASFAGMEHETAVQIYKYAQEQEQAWEEKHRIRSMEENRAEAGGFSFGYSGFGVGGGQADQSLVSELEKIKRLLDSGAINDAEYQEIKAKLLSKMY